MTTSIYVKVYISKYIYPKGSGKRGKFKSKKFRLKVNEENSYKETCDILKDMGYGSWDINMWIPEWPQPKQ